MQLYSKFLIHIVTLFSYFSASGGIESLNVVVDTHNLDHKYLKHSILCPSYHSTCYLQGEKLNGQLLQKD